jgi:hypothetical protein
VDQAQMRMYVHGMLHVVQHNVMNQQVEISGDQATCLSKGIAYDEQLKPAASDSESVSPTTDSDAHRSFSGCRLIACRTHKSQH